MSFIVRKLKIGYYLSDGRYSPHPGCQRAVKEAVTTLREMGHTVVEVNTAMLTQNHPRRFLLGNFVIFCQLLNIILTQMIFYLKALIKNMNTSTWFKN